MADEDGEFYVDSEEEEVREVKHIEDANPIYSKPISQEPKNVALKMVEVPKNNQPTLYQYFKIKKKTDSGESDSDAGQQNLLCPFTEFYSPQQLIYQRYNNEQFNKVNEMIYFAGAFIQKNIFFDYMKEDSQSLVEVIQEYFEIDENPQTFPETDDPVFDSNFDSGNLFAAFRVGKNSYDLIMQNDTNSKGNNQWFYFSVEKLVSGIDYTFNVVNFTKNDSLFNYGMAPAVYSELANKRNGTEWFRMGKDVVYKKGLIPKENSRRHYYQLSFKINWKYNNDKLYIAHSYPYPYAKLNAYLESVLNKNKEIVAKITIGKTLSKKPIQCLIIAHQPNKKKDSRKAIIFMARQHPGETQGSYVCQGVIQKLVQKCKESQSLRKNYVVYVIPMVNPDGVIFGHYRTNLAGKDLNRKWDATEKDSTCPEVTCIKNFLQEISKEREIRFILDLHGHSKKLNSFFYGNPCPENPQHVRIFPYVCSKLNPAVQFYDCTFATQQYKRKAARVYLSYLYKQLHVYTYQSSFYGYFKDGKKVQFTPKEYANLGHTLVQVLQLQLETDSRTGVFHKYLTELKNNKNLLQIGNNGESGSESKPEEGEMSLNDIPKMKIKPKKSQAPQVQTETLPIQKNNSRKSHSRRAYRQYPKEYREVIKPVRNFKFLEISRVNSVLPDKYQLGLQPIRKKQTEISMPRNQSSVMRINSHCQTDRQFSFTEFKEEEIESSCNLSTSMKLDSFNERRYSSVIKNTSKNNNIIFKIDFLKPTASISKAKEKKLLNAYTQTMISFYREKNQKNRSSQLLPVVESPETNHRMTRTNNMKYDTMKVGMKRQAEIFLNGMVKKYLVEKEIKSRDPVKVMERPLSIKKKQIYKK